MQNFYRLYRSIFLLLCYTAVPSLLSAQTKEETIHQRQLNQKLAPILHSSLAKNTANSYRLAVKDKAAFKAWLKEQKLTININETSVSNNNLLITGVKGSALRQILNCPHITYIDRANRTPKEETELKDVNFIVNNILAVQTAYPHLSGQGMAASVKEGAFNPADLDLKSRVIAPEKFGKGHTQHATTMATIIAGAGNTGPKGKGIATKALMATSDFKELMPENSATLLSTGISVQNHSYGVGVENYYGLESVAYDQQTFQNKQLLHVFSSGNSGNKAGATGTYANLAGYANLTGQFKTSKNTLSVGALEPNNKVGALSSKGPAYDGRIKPELVAYGIGGTSEAAAVVSGVALLLQQAYKTSFNGALPSAALLKAALINSADDVGRKAVDFESGFGNTDALGAVRSILQKRFIEGSVSQGEQKKYTINVPSGAKQLKVTIVWHDKEAAPNAPAALINDLDLQVNHSGSGNKWQPWVLSTYPHPDSLSKPAKRGIDRLNNVEQVTVDMPVAGQYEMVINGYKVADVPQEFSIVYEYENNLEWLYPSLGLSLQAGEVNKIRWQGPITNQTAQLEYKFSGEQTWRFIKEVNLADLNFDWNTPDTVASAQIRLKTANTITESEHFILTKQLKLKIGFNCVDNTMVYWPNLKGAKNYQLLHVSGSHPQTFFTTSDTLAILNSTVRNTIGDHILVAPVIDGFLGETSEFVAFEPQGTGCYIKSFLPEQFVMDTIILKLELSTLYQLKSLTLERKQNGGFQAIKTLQPISGLSINLTDSNPNFGRSFYRVKVETQNGQAYYSTEEEVIYASKGFVQIYPNPVVAGKPMHIAVAGDEAQIQLYDKLGKLLRDSNEIGVVKTIETTGLAKGLYIIRVKAKSGIYTSSRVLIL